MPISFWKTLWAPDDKRGGPPPGAGEHTVVSVGEGPETMRGGGGGGDQADVEPTLPDQERDEELDLFKGPQQENA